MSLIHEALKKAEEQRRLGEPPGLGSGFVRPREQRSFLPVLLVAIVIAGGAGWWFTRSSGPGPERAATNPKAAAGKPAANAGANPPASGGMAPSTQKSPDSGIEHVAARSTAADHQPVPPPPPLPAGSAGLPPGSMPMPPPVASKFRPPVLPAAKEGGERESASMPAGVDANPVAKADNAQIDRSQGEGVKARVKARREAEAAAAADKTHMKTAPVEKAAPIPMPDTGPTTRQPVAVAPPPPLPTNDRPLTPVPATPAPPTPAPGNVVASGEGQTKPEPVAAAPAPAATTTGAAKPNDTPLFWQLPYNVRKDLPAFTVSMHVYSADPAKRFVVINGDRKAEGDTLGTDIALREIRTDGVVLEIKGQRFLVPRGGT